MLNPIELKEVVQILDYIEEAHTFCEYPAKCGCCGTSQHRECLDLQAEGVKVDTGPFPFPCEGCVARQDIMAWLDRNRPKAR